MSEQFKPNNGKSTEPVGAVLVCGAGIAGIQSSLDLANSGFKVFLLESSPAIGGRMAQLDKTFPTGDCAMCTLSPKLVECARNKNVEIITLADIDKVSGEPGNFQVSDPQATALCGSEEVQRLRRVLVGVPGFAAQRIRSRARHAQGDFPSLSAGHSQRLRHFQGRRPRPVQGIVSGRRECAGLRGPACPGQDQRSLRRGSRALSLARRVRPGLPAPLRDQVQPQRHRRASGRARSQALCR
jgi:hypothetical protein